MAIADFFSSIFTTVHADEEKSADAEKQVAANSEEQAESTETPAEEEEEEEPEDALPELREQCQTGQCASLTKHFEHCQEKVQNGDGFKGEDCVEEMCHMMHCVDACVAPKLFSKLR
ncbi:QCR6, subunit of the ubiquinol cytochrome-c reductase complex [Pleurotus ostreatus PC15]|uniref:QCR6, subunit of the ubiquinol cytochrome-c reductase complex n=1 Tax=Pleurotus ostreatus (strain PC15) TaxID=1137138 RepID=A0A067NSD9_PLEO1|nr:QCR6, subunit of the ubiquinol cytochrome-c reductase complex [Pleurotus ostreatus PC15]